MTSPAATQSAEIAGLQRVLALMESAHQKKVGLSIWEDDIKDVRLAADALQRLGEERDEALAMVSGLNGNVHDFGQKLEDAESRLEAAEKKGTI